MDARIAIAEAIAHEADTDLTPEFIRAIDLVLIQLYLRGYIVTSISEKINADQRS